MYAHFQKNEFGFYTTISIFSHGSRYDIKKGRVPQQNGVKTIVDYLKFENDEVFNYFVDRKSIEKVIVTDDHTAQQLFSR